MSKHFFYRSLNLRSGRLTRSKNDHVASKKWLNFISVSNVYFTVLRTDFLIIIISPYFDVFNETIFLNIETYSPRSPSLTAK
jgi:hypothetical protein